MKDTNNNKPKSALKISISASKIHFNLFLKGKFIENSNILNYICFRFPQETFGQELAVNFNYCR
jgi:hypothetical protein